MSSTHEPVAIRPFFKYLLIFILGCFVLALIAGFSQSAFTSDSVLNASIAGFISFVVVTLKMVYQKNKWGKIVKDNIPENIPKLFQLKFTQRGIAKEDFIKEFKSYLSKGLPKFQINHPVLWGICYGCIGFFSVLLILASVV